MVAPEADASVGVQIPVKMLPRTPMINAMGGIRDFKVITISFGMVTIAASSGGMAGPCSG